MVNRTRFTKKNKLIFNFFLISFFTLNSSLFAVEEVPPQPVRVVLFDISEQTSESILQMYQMFSGNRGKSKRGSEERDTEYKEGSIYCSDLTDSTFYGGPLNAPVPSDCKLFLEGEFQYSIGQREERLSSIRLGFKIPGMMDKDSKKGKQKTQQNSSGPSVRLYTNSKAKDDKDLAVRIFSGPAITFGGGKGQDGEESKEMIFSSSPTVIPIPTSQILRVKLLADAKNSEIVVWINEVLIFKGKCNFNGNIGEFPPIDLIDGFYVRFEGQNGMNSTKPAFAKSIRCYYMLN